jgi:hypothetical protein
MDRADDRSHLAAGVGRVDEDVLSEADKRRFLEEVKDNFWVKRDNGWVLDQIKAELDEIDGVSIDKSTEEEEDTEIDEEIEVIKRS